MIIKVLCYFGKKFPQTHVSTQCQIFDYGLVLIVVATEVKNAVAAATTSFVALSGFSILAQKSSMSIWIGLLNYERANCIRHKVLSKGQIVIPRETMKEGLGNYYLTVLNN